MPEVFLVRHVETKFRNVDNDRRLFKVVRKPAPPFESELQLNHAPTQRDIELLDCVLVDDSIRFQSMAFLEMSDCSY